MSVSWGYYDRYEGVIHEYMPLMGEGESQASQVVTAVNKLIYKWYNDGDVFDNTYYLEGWYNDLSSYANWLWEYTSAGVMLKKIEDCHNASDYEDLLKAIADATLSDERVLKYLSAKEKIGSIYDCSGPFKFEEYNDDEDDYEFEEEYDDDEEEEEWDD